MTKIIKQIIVFLALIPCARARSWELGIENIGSQLDNFKQKNIALVANQSSINQEGISTLTILQNAGFTISTILAPEHGFSGTTAAGKIVHDSVDEQNRVPIISLYGGDHTHTIPPKILATIDAIFFDLPHCGMRHYTYISTLYTLLDCAAQFQIPVVVFDRPNPLGPLMEGPLVDKNLHSFISIAPIPLRYALSMGELAQYFNNHILKHKAPLAVVRMNHYRRTHSYPSLRAPLSPNIPTRASCYGYSFLGLLEEIYPCYAGSNGTQKPFQYILLPETLNLTHQQWHTIRMLLARYKVTSSPTRIYRAKKQLWYTGLELGFPAIHSTKSFSLFLQLLKTFKRFGVPLRFSPSFDKAIGTANVREYIQGTVSYRDLTRAINHGLEKFYQKARDCLLYEPLPVLSRQELADSTTYAKRKERSHAAKKSSIS